jgi:flagellar basal body-associated protein FliL
MDRPPPYFPQSQLSPPDPNRYKKFKAIVALVIIGVLLIVGAVGYGIYYLIMRAAS